jgi:hypothetical protein
LCCGANPRVGDLRVDDLTIEKIKLKQCHAQTNLENLKLSLRNVQAQWSGGEVRGTFEAAFSANPRYEIAASFERVLIVQTPWLARLSDRLAGTASGALELRATGIGRDALLGSLRVKANCAWRMWNCAVGHCRNDGHWRMEDWHFALDCRAGNFSFERRRVRFERSAAGFCLRRISA